MTPVNANDENTMKDDAGFVGRYEFQPVERFTPPRLTETQVRGAVDGNAIAAKDGVKFVALRTSNCGRQVLLTMNPYGQLVAGYVDQYFWGQRRTPGTVLSWMDSIVLIDLSEPQSFRVDFHSEDTAEIEAEFPNAVWFGPFDTPWTEFDD